LHSMRPYWIVLFILPFSLSAQTHANKPSKGFEASSGVYVFHDLMMDDFLTTSPDKGGTVVYNRDTTGMKIDGEIEVNAQKKYIEIIYLADRKHPMRAMIDGNPISDKFDESYTYKGHWTDTKEKTEITIGSDDTARVIKVLFGPHKGDYATYWDRIYKFRVARKD